MDETDTKIAVSSISEISSFNMERIITIKGEIDDMSRAEAEISSKLRAAYEADVQAMAVSTLKTLEYLGMKNIMPYLIKWTIY